MWENPLVQQNVTKLKSLGYRFVGPEEGRLACQDIVDLPVRIEGREE